MFGSRLVGPVLYVKYKDVHFLGEYHHINGTGKDDSDYVLSKLTKGGELTLIIEASPLDLPILKSGPVTSPLKQLAHGLRTLSDNIVVQLANIRCTSPFLVFEAIYNFEGFADMSLTKNTQTFVEEYRALWKASKRFEKQFVSRVAKSRLSCIRFMKSLAHPDHEPPTWFTTCLRDMNLSLENPFKDTMRELRQKDTALFDRLMGVMGSMFDRAVLGNEHFSPGMHTAEKNRRTGSQNMVLDKSPYLQAFWVAVNSIFMDVFVIYSIFSASPSRKTVVLAGASHIVNIIRHFDQAHVQYTYDPSGVLDLTTLRPGPIANIHKSPKSLLRNFIERA